MPLPPAARTRAPYTGPALPRRSLACRVDTLATLRALGEGLPVPDGRWHPYADRIARASTDDEAALAVLAQSPQALDELERRLESEERAGEAPALAAHARLEQLPRPEGQHPFLDTICPRSRRSS